MSLTSEQLSSEDWKRLAAELMAARVRLGYRLRSHLVHHLVETGAASPSIDRILGDLERGARSNYRATTLASVEYWYGFKAGTIARVLHNRSKPTRRRSTAKRQDPPAVRDALGSPDQALREATIQDLTPETFLVVVGAVLKEAIRRHETSPMVLRATTPPLPAPPLADA